MQWNTFRFTLLLTCNRDDIMQEDWTEHTVYQGYAAEASPVRWLWETIHEFEEAEKVHTILRSTFHQFLLFVVVMLLLLSNC